MRNTRFLVESVLLLALVITAAYGARHTKVIDAVENIGDDIATAHLTPDARTPHPGVAVVAIDEQTIRTLPARSPIDRAFLAKLVAILDAAKPVAIGIDVVFFEPSFDPAPDAALAEAIANAETPVVLITGLKGGERRPLAPPFGDGLAEVALANLPVDRIDRTLRTYRTAFADNGGVLHETFAVALARHAGVTVEITTDDVPIDWYGRPGWQGRALDDGSFAGTPAVAILSASSLLKAPAAAMLLRGKIALIGATFERSHDSIRTPFELLAERDPRFPAVFAHAQILAQMLDGRARVLPGPAAEFAAMLAAALIGMALGLWRLPAPVSLLGGIAIPVLWALGVFYLREETALMLPIAPPVIACWLSLIAFALLRARRREKAMRNLSDFLD